VKPSLRHRFEHGALRAAAGLAGILPYRAALTLGWVAAWAGFACARRRVETAKARIRQVFGPGVSPREVTGIAWRSWRNLAFSAIEIMRAPRATAAWIRSVSECDPSVDRLGAHCATGEGGIIAGPHMGNWELAGVIFRAHGVPIFSIAAKQRNPLTDSYLNALRERAGVPSVARGGGAMKEAIRRLRGGQVLAILPDVRVREGGIQVPFLGGTANVGTGMALFARHAGVPVFPSFAGRKGWAAHTLRVSEPIRPDPGLSREDDVRRMTEAVLRGIDAAIRNDPGQWFWFNSRWVLDPPEPGRKEASVGVPVSLSLESGADFDI
jgi:KDO2-lipid IV(A) lauroyltransferase